MGAIVYAQLATELNTDPAARGYAPLIAAKNDAALAALLNEPIVSVQIDRETVEPFELFDALVYSELATRTAVQITHLNLLFTQTRIRVKSQVTRDMLITIFAGAPGAGTRARLQALQTRNGSRAESLFGIDTRVTDADVSKALRVA